MNQELYHEIEKYIHHIEWYSDFDIYLIHLNLNVDIYRYGTNVLLYLIIISLMILFNI